MYNFLNIPEDYESNFYTPLHSIKDLNMDFTKIAVRLSHSFGDLDDFDSLEMEDSTLVNQETITYSEINQVKNYEGPGSEKRKFQSIAQ